MEGYPCAHAPEDPREEPRGSLWRIVVGRVGWMLVHMLIVGAALEGAARGYAALAGRERILQSDPVLGWRLVPGAAKRHVDEQQPYWIRVNGNGLRDRERPFARRPGVRRVAVLGDSYVFGAGGVEEGETFAARLERMVPGAEFINLGMFGYSTDQQYLWLREEGLRYRPDVVLLCIAPSDVPQCFTSYADRIGRPKGYIRDEAGALAFSEMPAGHSWDWLTEQSYVAALVERRMQWSASRYRRGRMDAVGHRGELVALERLIGMFRDLTTATGAKLVVSCLPERDARPGTIPCEAICALAENSGITAINLASQGSFRTAEDARRMFFASDMHFNESGHAEVARLLAAQFTERLASASSNEPP